MISRIIRTEVCVICRSLRLRLIIRARGFDNSWCHEKTEFNNNCAIIHPQPQKQRRSVQPFCFWGEYFKGLGNQADFKLDMINAMSAADTAFITSSSQAIVNWLNARDRLIRFFIESLMYNNFICLSRQFCTQGPLWATVTGSKYFWVSLRAGESFDCYFQWFLRVLGALHKEKIIILIQLQLSIHPSWVSISQNWPNWRKVCFSIFR